MNRMMAQLVKNSFLLLYFFSSQLIAAEPAIIAAAASLKFAVNDIAKAFQKETGKSVRISYSSSGNLTRQIQQGGPFELFLSANSHYVEKLYQQKKTLDQGVTYALGRMVLLSNKTSLTSLDNQLKGIKQAVQNSHLKRFAIANPIHAPYGVAAKEILQHQGLWAVIQPHLVLGENVAQATQFASSGAAQAGLVSYALALSPVLQKTTSSILIPTNMHQPLKQTAVLLKGAGSTARLFYNYLQQNKASTILSQYGFSKP